MCNLREQVPETAGYDVAAHVDALLAHGVVPDVVLAHPRALPAPGPDTPWAYVERPVARADLAGHDPELLAEALVDLGRAAGRG